MGRFEPYSRRALRRHRVIWLRRNVAVVAFILVGIGLMVALATTVLLTVTSGPATLYTLVHAALVAAGLHLLNSAFLALDREALWHLRGAWGEENTRSELQRARRRRLIWGWVDSINLRAGDLDHVVIPRRGRLIALDSKWRNEAKGNDTAELARAALRAKTRAEGLARTLLKVERGARHRVRLQSLSVTPVVVWGAAQSGVPDGAMIDGVRFIAGRKLLAWLRVQDGEVVPKDAALDALERLREYRSTTWEDA